jgi:hypothetical protein
MSSGLAARSGSLGVACVTVLVLGLAVSGSPASAAGGPPAAFASLGAAAPGQMIDVTGIDWTPIGGLATVQICGQDAQNLTSDCDESNTYSAAIRPGGGFGAALTVRLPLTPCPCVIYVTSQDGASAKVPLQIVGAPVQPITEPPATSVPVRLVASLSTPLSVSSWFGGPRHETLKLRVSNLESIALRAVAVSVTVGRSNGSAAAVAGRTLPLLAVGATRTLQIPLTIPAFTYGHYTVTAHVATEEGDTSKALQTTSWPWALFVIGIELVLLAVTAVLRRLRRRRVVSGQISAPRESIEAPKEQVPETV